MNVTECKACRGTGAQEEHHLPGYTELLACDECWGTGFEDPAEGVSALRSELDAAQKHANDLGDLLAKVEQERDGAQTTIATLRQECYGRMEVCIGPACTYKETLLGVYCQEVVLAILTNREGEQ